MKPVTLTADFAARTARGERRRIRSFIKEIEALGVGLEDLPPISVKALTEAERFLGKYIDLLGRETPTPEQLDGVMEGLGGIDRVVRNAMAEILRSLGWRPDAPEEEPAPKAPGPEGEGRPSRGVSGREDHPVPGPEGPPPDLLSAFAGTASSRCGTGCVRDLIPLFSPGHQSLIVLSTFVRRAGRAPRQRPGAGAGRDAARQGFSR